MIKLRNNENKRVRAIRHAESEALFSSIGDGAISTNEKGEITRINDTAIRILGIENEDVVGIQMSDLFDMIEENGEKIPEDHRPLALVLKKGETITKLRASIKRKRASDPIIHLEFTISPIKMKDKNLGSIIIFRDDTEEYKIDQMKNDFISLASHQLRTPLSSIQVYSNMLLDGTLGNLTENQINYIKTIVKSTNRMNGVISSLTNISKLDSNSVRFKPKKTNITQILEGVFHENRLAIKEKNIIYKNNFDKENHCIIVTDSILVTEIINNLVSNAVKYTPNGGKVIATAMPTELGVIIEIKDDGIGINTKDKDKIFDKFFRAPGITKQETFGSGLGLYIVKGFLEIIGGSVNFVSKTGEGTTFEVFIPNINENFKSV